MINFCYYLYSVAFQNISKHLFSLTVNGVHNNSTNTRGGMGVREGKERAGVGPGLR